MSSSADRVLEIQRAAIPARLRRGAEVLGRLWRAGQRCANSWGNGCLCGPAATDFCAAKLKWLGLLIEFYGGHPWGLLGDEEFYVIEAMTEEQFKASGLTAIVEVQGACRPIRFGARGTSWETLIELGILNGRERASAIEAVLLIQGVGL